MAKNVFIRSGPRVEMRSGWMRDSDQPSAQTGRLIHYTAADVLSGTDKLIASPSSNTTGGYMSLRATDGTYSDIGSLNFYAVDSVGFLGKVYMLQHPNLYDTGVSYDGTTVDTNAFGTISAGVLSGFSGNSITSYNHRLFLAGIAEARGFNNLLNGTDVATQFENAAKWTLTGCTVAVTGNVRTLTIAAAGDSAKTFGSVLTTTEPNWVTVRPQFKARSATTSMPFTVTVEDAAGTTVWGSMDILVASSSINPEWQTFVKSFLLPAGVTAYIKYKPGNASVAAVTGSVDVGDKTGVGKGLAFYQERFVFTKSYCNSAEPLGDQVMNMSRLMWCEVDSPSNWRPNAYYDCREIEGPLTTVRSINGMLCAFKSNGIWVFGQQDNADLPIVFLRLLENVGCISTTAIDHFRNRLYFVGENEVYEWSGDGNPTPLAGPGMRETLFNSTTLAATAPLQVANSGGLYPLLRINVDDEEVWVYLQPGKLYVYSLITQTWTGPITITGVDGADLEINDLMYMKPQGETRREMWAALKDTKDIIKLRTGQTLDNITGTEREVTAEYWVRPLITKDPKQTFLVETIDIDHKITGDQTDSTTTYRVSFDGGTTWDAENTIEIAPLASGDYQPMTVDLWQSDERMTIAIKHTGKAGPEYFNFSGASATVQILGERIQRSNPTAVSSNL